MQAMRVSLEMEDRTAFFGYKHGGLREGLIISLSELPER
jgi:hypothetical protein